MSKELYRGHLMSLEGSHQTLIPRRMWRRGGEPFLSHSHLLNGPIGLLSPPSNWLFYQASHLCLWFSLSIQQPASQPTVVKKKETLAVRGNQVKAHSPVWINCPQITCLSELGGKVFSGANVIYLCAVSLCVSVFVLPVHLQTTY